MGGVDADKVLHWLCADTLESLVQGVSLLWSHDARADCDSREIRHLVCADRNLLRSERPRRGLEDEVEIVLMINRQPRDLRARVRCRVGNRARLGVVPEEGEGAQGSSREVDPIPFENYTRLRSVPYAKLRL